MDNEASICRKKLLSGVLLIETQLLQTLYTHTRVSRYQKGKTNLHFTEARDSEWQWHQLGHMQVCTSLQTENHASTSPLSFLQAGCPSCHPTNSVKALNAKALIVVVSTSRCASNSIFNIIDTARF